MVIATSALIAILLDEPEADDFAKGNHPAGLNIGDCCACALAKYSGEPLLFKGDDFSRTDLKTLSRPAASRNLK